MDRITKPTHPSINQRRRIASAVAVSLFAMSAPGFSSGCGDSPQPPESSAKEISSFAFLSAKNPGLAVDVTAPVNDTTVTATVPFGTSVTALVATFSITGASVTIGDVAQVSGKTANDFTNPVVYRVTAADRTTKDYKVTITVAPSQAKDLTALSFRSTQNAGLSTEVIATINGTTVTATVPFGASVTALVATFSITGASVTVGGTAQTSGTTPNNFTSPVIYRVVAADGSTKDYTVTVTVAGGSAKDLVALAFRSTDNAGLAADVVATFNGTTVTATAPFGTNVTALVATFSITGASVTVGGTAQTSGTTPNNFTSPVIYHVVAADSSTKDYTVTVTVADGSAKDLVGMSFRSTDNTGLPADVVATITSTTVTAIVPYSTNLRALVAAFSITGASVTVGGTTQVSGVTANDFTNPVIYRVVAPDSSTKDYTVTVTVASAQKDLTAFAFLYAQNSGLPDDVFATIKGTDVTAAVPIGTPLVALVATFSTTGASVTVGGTAQTSDVTRNDFTSPVIYRVIGADSSTEDYTVTVTVQTYVQASRTSRSR